MRERIDIDAYFMNIALAVAQRSTCLDKQVGCVIVNKHNRIVSTGYNGAPAKSRHCSQCQVKLFNDKNLCPAAHAEQNALLWALPEEVHLVYCTLEPCITCTRMLLNTLCVGVRFLHDTNPKRSGAQLWRHAQMEKQNPHAFWYKFKPSGEVNDQLHFPF